MKLSMVIPCYNEAESIPLMLKRFQKVISDESIEIIMVNNGSHDNSGEILRQTIKNYDFARSITVPVNLGYGYGILEGLKICRGDFLGWMHGDIQVDPHNVITAYNILKKNNWSEKIYVKGHRHCRSLCDSFFTFGMGIFESILLKSWMFDINAQPNIISRTFFKSWQNPPRDYSFDLFALYMAKLAKIDIYRFDVAQLPRMHGVSSWNSGIFSRLKLIKRTLNYSFKLRKVLKNG